MSEETAPVETGEAVEAPVEAGQAEVNSENLWYDSAPDEVKGYIQNKGWDDPFKTVEAYQNLEKFHGVPADQLLKLPKDMSEDGALDDIYDKLGRPESPDMYKVEFPDGVDVDGSRMAVYQDAAHKIGLSQSQFEALAKLDAEYISQVQEKFIQEREQKQTAEYEALKREWGASASEREELSRRGLRALIPEGVNKEEIVAAIEDSIGTATTLKLFANAGEKLAREDKIHDSGDDRPFGYTREQALADKKALMSELSTDKERLNAYNSGKGPDYDKMKRINEIIAS